jgi:hypothetical protein
VLIKFGWSRDVCPSAAVPVTDPDSPERLVRFFVRVVLLDDPIEDLFGYRQDQR